MATSAVVRRMRVKTCSRLQSTPHCPSVRIHVPGWSRSPRRRGAPWRCRACFRARHRADQGLGRRQGDAEQGRDPEPSAGHPHRRRAKIDIPHDYDPPLVQSVTIWISKGGNYNGGKYPTCSPQTMERSGLRTCPASSIMGHAIAKADADGVAPSEDHVVNGGARLRLLLHRAVITRTRSAAVAATITKLTPGAGGTRLRLQDSAQPADRRRHPAAREGFHVNAGYKS